ncbi:ABC transporter permease [Nonomuraea sp. NPDC052634]|uniref:ABC transporter permease n=1 Tax=Nonomuraea sp. NPDC052634 TaxID=3155813 RepID=UPI00343D6E85
MNGRAGANEARAVGALARADGWGTMANRWAAVANEFAKMRHLRMGVVASVMVIIVVGLSVGSAATSPAFAEAAGRSWEALLAGMSLAVPLASPLLLAVMASRQVDIEHQGNGWLLSQTSGLTPGGLCRIKLLAVGIVVAAATVLESVLLLGAGLLLGVPDPVPAGLWAGYTASVSVANLVVLALHILLSARIDNQLVGLGIGVLGTIVAVFATALPPAAAHVTPWGYYALAAAAGYEGERLVAMTPAYGSIAALGVVAAAFFLFITGRSGWKEG